MWWWRANLQTSRTPSTTLRSGLASWKLMPLRFSQTRTTVQLETHHTVLTVNVLIIDTAQFCIFCKFKKNKLPSNLRPTTCEYVHLLTYGKWQRYVTWNFLSSCLHAAPRRRNARAVWAVVVILWLKRRGGTDVFCSCDRYLDPTTFIYELDSYYLELCRKCKYELPTSRLSKVIIRQTNAQNQNYCDETEHS